MQIFGDLFGEYGYFDYFCNAYIENIMIMAKPIAPTPVLKGQAAIDFIQELSQNKKASEEETMRVNKGAERIKAMLTFSF
ncbi:MAG: hypothetical protein ACI4B3_09530 [Prevotella sp.]